MWRSPVARNETPGNPRGRSPRNQDQPDTVTLVTGVVALAVSGYVLLGGFEGVRLQWMLPLIIIGIGIVVLITSVFPRRDG